MSKLGQLIGEGKSRLVFEYLPNLNWVIKQNRLYHDTNYDEFMTYTMFKSFGFDHLLAECKQLDGMHLMKRAIHPIPSGKYEIEVFSPKSKNWGMIDGKVVRIDYAWKTSFVDGNYYTRFHKRDLVKHSYLSSYFIQDANPDVYLVHMTLDSFHLLVEKNKFTLEIM